MLKLIFISLTFSSFFIANAQRNKSSIEIYPFVRFDEYPAFSYSINQVNSNDVNIKGTSWGINMNYKLGLKKKFYFKAGVGYYKYSFNNIDSYNSLFGHGTGRVINFPSPYYLIYGTNKYWYHCISGNIGIEKLYDIKKNLKIASGINLSHFYTCSQYYRVGNNNRYELDNKRFFGLSGNASVALLKSIGRISVGPSIVLPIYDIWKQDQVFPKSDGVHESNSSTRNKWFGGIGLGVSINYSLTKK